MITNIFFSQKEFGNCFAILDLNTYHPNINEKNCSEYTTVCNVHTRLFLTLDWVSWLEVSWPCAIILQMRNFLPLRSVCCSSCHQNFSWLRLTILKKPRQNFLLYHWNPSKNLAFWNVLYPFYWVCIILMPTVFLYVTMPIRLCWVLGWYQWSFFYSWQIQGLRTLFDIFNVFNTKLAF